MTRSLLTAIGLALGLKAAHAADWPQILGPNRNSVAEGKGLAAQWPKEGPPFLWKRNVGQGFAGPVVSEGRLILFHRVDDNEVVEAMDAATGKLLWKREYPTSYRDDFNFDPGPRAVPSVADGKVFTFGASGMLSCFTLADGKKLWAVDCRHEFGAPKGFFGLACSPLIEAHAVIVDVGAGKDATLIAFDKSSGRVLWKSADDEPSYSSPVAATIGGKRLILACTRSYFIGAEASTGKVTFQLPFRPPVNASVTGAAPLVSGDEVFISAGYDLGAQLLKIGEGQPKVIWQGDDQMSLQFTSAALKGGFLYGLHGRHDFPGGTELRCVEWKTGKVRWSKAGLSPANLLLAGDQLLVLTESGQLLKAEATPDGYKETGRAQIIGSGVRAYPALANGRFHARDKSRLICVKLGDN